MTVTPPDLATLQLRVPATPDHTNTGGDIFGGWIMAQVDIAGSIPAVRRCRGRVVTVAVNHFVFHKPVFAGDMVSVYADICKIGTSSMTVDVQVLVERNPEQPETLYVADAQLVYVAVNSQGRPRPVSDIRI